MASVTLDRVSLVYPSGIAGVRDVSLRVNDGEFLVLVGPSGSGKTTTLRLVAGLEQATSGSVRIGDRVVTDWPPRKRDVALVPQQGGLHPHWSVEQNLAFPLQLRHGIGWEGWGARGCRKLFRSRERLRKAVLRRVRQVVRQLEIEDLLVRRPEELSAGQRQRVALGRALVRRPSVFLWDEPLANLDPAARRELRQLMIRLQRAQPRTTLYVTHDHEDAFALADRVAVLDQGRLLQIDTPDEVYRRPANVAVARSFGQPPMNLLEGRACELDGALDFVSPGFRLRMPAAVQRAVRGEQRLTLGWRPYQSLVPSETPENPEANERDAGDRDANERDAGGRGTIVSLEPWSGQSLATVALRTGPGLDDRGGPLVQVLLLREAKLREAKLRAGATIRVTCDPDAASWFDTDSGQRLPELDRSFPREPAS